MTHYLMGIDIGTSACKVAIFDEKGEAIASATGSYCIYYPKAGYVEQDPNEWWAAVCKAIKACINKANISPQQIAGIGVDGQGWAAVPIDEKGNVLANTPIWLDTRSREICEILKQEVDEKQLFEKVGNTLQPTYTTGKILWFKKFVPEIYNRTATILQSNSFIVYRLTGVISQDKSQGYGYHCFDMRSGEWDESLCKILGIPISLLPNIYECSEVVGRVSQKAANECGLIEGIPVVAGGLDAACGALGAGVIHEGETQEQGGQAGGMSICCDTYHADPSLILGTHVIPGKWLLQGGTTGGSGVMRWIEQELGNDEREKAKGSSRNSFELLGDLAECVKAGSEGLIFLPYMMGERSPIWNPHAKGVYYGLDFKKTKGHLIRAAMEGVAYSLKHNLDVAERAGAKVEVLRAMGGAANSFLWTQIKADITGREIIVPAADTATTLGAALLAGVGVGLYKGFEEAITETIQVRRTHRPNQENREVYTKGYENYLQLYLNLKTMMDGRE